MSSDVKYTPLSPVYKIPSVVNDEEIALEELSAAPKCDTKSSDSCCSEKKDSCCSKDGKRMPLGRRIARCFCATLLVGLCLWMITGAAVVTYFGAKAHRCLHPRYSASSEFTWTPATLPSLELGVVAGSLTIRSCPKAKNVTLTVRTFAGTEDLLNTMVISREALVSGGGERLVLLAPSFDWMHCQRAHLDLVIPEGAQINVKAQAIVGRVDVRASKSALHNLVISSNAGHIDLHESQLSGTLRVDSEVGCVRARDVEAQDVHTDLRVGFLDMRDVTSSSSLHSTLRLGKASLSHVRSSGALVHVSEVASVSVWDASAPIINARVDYGALRVAVSPEFTGHFIARSPYGFIKAMAPPVQSRNYNLVKETPALIEGDITSAVEAAGALKRSVTLDAVYGSVDFFVPEPETAWEKNHRRHP